MFSDLFFPIAKQFGLVDRSDGEELIAEDVRPTLKFLWLWSFLVLAILFSVVSAGLDLLSVDLKNSWFQRSGSILAVTALLVKTQLRLDWETRLMWTRHFERAGLTASDLEKLNYNTNRFNSWNYFFNSLASFATILGTVIWGYGDYLFR